MTLGKFPRLPPVPPLPLGNDSVHLDFTKCMHFPFCIADRHILSSFTYIYCLIVYMGQESSSLAGSSVQGLTMLQ